MAIDVDFTHFQEVSSRREGWHTMVHCVSNETGPLKLYYNFVKIALISTRNAFCGMWYCPIATSIMNELFQ